MNRIIRPHRGGRQPKPAEHPDFPDMTPEEIGDFLISHTFQRAKTMPEIPHAYLGRKKARDEKEWCRFVLHIRRHGYKAKFGKHTYRYLDVTAPDGIDYQYWTMGMPIYMTHVLNRAVKPQANTRVRTVRTRTRPSETSRAVSGAVTPVAPEPFEPFVFKPLAFDPF